MPDASIPTSHRQPDGCNVIVVDDDVQVRKFIANVLTFDGFRAITVANGTAAMELIRVRGDSIALVISDICMPGGNGLDFGAELQRTRPGMPVLYISGRLDSIAVQSILLRDPQAILTKPISAGGLIERVKILVGSRRRSDQLGALKMGPKGSSRPTVRRGKKLA